MADAAKRVEEAAEAVQGLLAPLDEERDWPGPGDRMGSGAWAPPLPGMEKGLPYALVELIPPPPL